MEAEVKPGSQTKFDEIDRNLEMTDVSRRGGNRWWRQESG